jgi:hypothetical protein
VFFLGWQQNHNPEHWHGDSYVHKIKLVRALGGTFARLGITTKFYVGLREAKDYVDRRKDAIVMKELLDEES